MIVKWNSSHRNSIWNKNKGYFYKLLRWPFLDAPADACFFQADAELMFPGKSRYVFRTLWLDDKNHLLSYIKNNFHRTDQPPRITLDGPQNNNPKSPELLPCSPFFVIHYLDYRVLEFSRPRHAECLPKAGLGSADWTHQWCRDQEWKTLDAPASIRIFFENCFRSIVYLDSTEQSIYPLTRRCLDCSLKKNLYSRHYVSDEHREIFQHIINGDEQSAGKSMRKHLKDVLEFSHNKNLF